MAPAIVAAERAATAGVLCALVAVPFAHLAAPGMDVWIDLFRRGVLGSVVVAAGAAVVLAGGGRALLASPLAAPLAALVAVQSLSALLGRSLAVGQVEVARVAVLALLALLGSLSAAAGGGRWAARAVLLAVPLAAVLGTLENRNDLGTLAAGALVLAVVLALEPGGDRIALALMPLVLAALLWSRTRGAWLAAGAVVALILGRRLAGAGRRALLAVVTGLVLLGATVALSRLPSMWSLAASAGGRLPLWRAAVVLFRERPWIGHGPGSFRVELARVAPELPLIALDVHDDLLQALAETGLLGTLALGWCFVAVARAARSDPAGRAWAWALAAVLLHSLTHMVLRVTAPAMLAFAAAGLAAPSRPREAGRSPSPAAGLATVLAGAIGLGVAVAPSIAAVSLVGAAAARKTGDRPATAAHAGRALRFDPALPEAYAMLAQARLLERDAALARAAADAGLAVAPFDPILHLRRAQAAQMAGDREAARRSYAEALRYGPWSEEVKGWRERIGE